MKTKFSARTLVWCLLLSLVLVSAPSLASHSAAAPRVECGVKLCFKTPQYYAFNYSRINFNGADIFISGVNLNHPVDSRTSPTPILFALRARGTSPLILFNQHYVAAQLTQAQVPMPTAVGARNTSLDCYGFDFLPVKVSSTGAELTPEMTLGEFFTQCDLVGIAPNSDERDQDMVALVQILSQLNTCR